MIDTVPYKYLSYINIIELLKQLKERGKNASCSFFSWSTKQ